MATFRLKPLFSALFFFAFLTANFFEAFLLSLSFLLLFRSLEDLWDAKKDKKNFPDRITPLDIGKPPLWGFQLGLAFLILTSPFVFANIINISLIFFLAGMLWFLRKISFVPLLVVDVASLLKYPVLFYILASPPLPWLAFAFVAALIYEAFTNLELKRIFGKSALLLLSLGAAFAPQKSHAGLDVTNDLTLSLGYKSSYLNPNTGFEWTTEGYGSYSPSFLYSVGRWSFSLAPSLQVLKGPEQIPSAFDIVSSLTSKRDQFITRHVDGLPGDQTATDIDVAYIEYANSFFSQTIGRRPLGFGTLKYFSLWNKFSPNLISSLSTYRLENPDYIGTSFFNDTASVSAYYVAGGTRHTTAALINPKLTIQQFETQLLLGNWWNHWTAGFAASADLFGAAWRFESLYVENKDDPTKKDMQFAAGIDVALNSWITWSNEGLFYSEGAHHGDDYHLQTPTPFRNLIASTYLLSMLSFQSSMKFSEDVGFFLNVIDGSFLTIFKIKYSWTSSLDIYLQGFVPSGESEVEFGTQSVYYDEETKIGPILPVSLTMSYVF